MRVLLVYSNQSRELVPAPPVGLSYVASATRAAGHDVRLLDLAFAREPQSELAAAIAGHAPDVVGLSIRNIDNVVLQRFESPRAALLAQVGVVRSERYFGKQYRSFTLAGEIDAAAAAAKYADGVLELTLPKKANGAKKELKVQ